MRSDFDMPAELGLAASQVPQLDSNERSRLLNFLLRWEHLAPLHACLDGLLAEKPDLVSLRDLRVRALVTEERFSEAVSLMQRRLELRSSLSAQALMARVHLAAGEIDAADGIAEALVTTAAGLIIALTAVIPQSVFNRWSDEIELEIEESTADFVEFILTHH